MLDMENKSNFSRTVLLFFITLFVLSYLPPAKAGLVTPVFSNYWYTAADAAGWDACDTTVYDYTNKYEGSAQTIAQKLLSNVPPFSNCQWGDAILIWPYPSLVPNDFPGTQDDWNYIASKPDSEVPGYWSRRCTDNKGNTISQVSVLLYPSYICPKGSRQGIEGCTTTPSTCSADIVGRDLKIIMPLNIPGHVGFISRMGPYNDSMVLEVLENPAGVQENPISQFKSLAKYWGEKYGLVNANIDLSQAYNIISTGASQESYPFQYTLGWIWHPGTDQIRNIYDQKRHTWLKIYADNSALFRCDSFVYYSYLAGANVHIVPEFVPPVVPLTLFNAFLHQRDPSGISIHKPEINPSVNLAYTQITSLLTQKQPNISQLDKATYAFVTDKSTPRTLKINYLWNLAKQYQDDSNKFSYLLDILSYLKPIELAPEYVKLFQSQTSHKNKIKLLFSMANAVSNLSSESLSSNVQNTIAIQTLFQNLLQTSTDKSIIPTVLQLYPSLFPPEQAQKDLQNFWSRKNVANIDSILPEDEKLLINLRIALADQDAQQNFLLPLLTTSFKDPEHEKLFSYLLCSKLASLPTTFLNDALRNPLAQYLLEHQATLMGPSYSSSHKLLTCNWLSAYGTVIADTQTEKYAMMLNYLLTRNNPLEQAKLLSHQDWHFIQTLSDGDKNYFRSLFQTALKQPNISSNDKYILHVAISAVHKLQHKYKSSLVFKKLIYSHSCLTKGSVEIRN